MRVRQPETETNQHTTKSNSFLFTYPCVFVLVNAKNRSGSCTHTRAPLKTHTQPRQDGRHAHDKGKNCSKGQRGGANPAAIAIATHHKKKAPTKISLKQQPNNNSVTLRYVTLAKVARVVRCGSSSRPGGDVTAASASWVQENAR